MRILFIIICLCLCSCQKEEVTEGMSVVTYKKEKTFLGNHKWIKETTPISLDDYDYDTSEANTELQIDFKGNMLWKGTGMFEAIIVPTYPDYLELKKDLVLECPMFNLDNEIYDYSKYTIPKGTKIYFNSIEAEK